MYASWDGREGREEVGGGGIGREDREVVSMFPDSRFQVPGSRFQLSIS